MQLMKLKHSLAFYEMTYNLEFQKIQFYRKYPIKHFKYHVSIFFKSLNKAKFLFFY